MKHLLYLPQEGQHTIYEITSNQVMEDGEGVFGDMSYTGTYYALETSD